MKINSLELINFRNYINGSMKFFNGINMLLGKNAQGKTNVLEAIYFMCTTKSFRTSNENNLINSEENVSKIEINILDKEISKNLSVFFERNGKKRLFINSKKAKKSSDFIGNIKASILIPEDIYIIKGEEALRRKFLDISLCQVDSLYLEKLISYSKIIKYRNLILKNIKIFKTNKKEIEPWNLKMVETAPYIIKKRLDFIKKIDVLSDKYNKILSNSSEKLKIKYINSLNRFQETDLDNYMQSLLKKLDEIFEEEIKRGASIIGPHRDEVVFQLDDSDLKYFGSQGQQRTAVTSLRLAEAEFMRDEISESPIILVDDIFSELDENRRTNLITLFDGSSQVFLTGTNASDFGGILKTENRKIFHIHEGTVLTP